jgi:hypothetical protein
MITSTNERPRVAQVHRYASIPSKNVSRHGKRRKKTEDQKSSKLRRSSKTFSPVFCDASTCFSMLLNNCYGSWQLVSNSSSYFRVLCLLNACECYLNKLLPLGRTKLLTLRLPLLVPLSAPHHHSCSHLTFSRTVPSLCPAVPRPSLAASKW